MSSIRRDLLDSFLGSIESSARIEGLTHNYYRYPARFPPGFARSAMEAFSGPGDVVLDPFVGGGTTAVEALHLGRRFLGTDVNPISMFVTRVKTTPLSDSDVAAVHEWIKNSHDRSVGPVKSRDGGAELLAHVPWWLERRISQLLRDADSLANSRQRDFARCTILKTAQWALDNRRRIASTREFLSVHRRHALEMLAARFSVEGDSHSSVAAEPSRFRLLCRSAEGLDTDRRIPADWRPVRLVVTSPPYPGVHVLYHRWQVQGRRETAAPFWIVRRGDGHSSSYYTMGPRYARDLSAYLVSLESAFRSITAMLDRDSIVVQLVGFSDAETQLGPFLDALDSAGLEEVREIDGRTISSRVWRAVPNRKWHATTSKSGSDREVLLVHQLAS